MVRWSAPMKSTSSHIEWFCLFYVQSTHSLPNGCKSYNLPFSFIFFLLSFNIHPSTYPKNPPIHSQFLYVILAVHPVDMKNTATLDFAFVFQAPGDHSIIAVWMHQDLLGTVRQFRNLFFIPNKVDESPCLRKCHIDSVSVPSYLLVPYCSPKHLDNQGS